MHVLAILPIVAILAGVPATGFTTDELWAEFDARALAPDEKRLLQFGLALAGEYAALVDGAWGEGSQRALEAWAKAEELAPPIENWEVVVLAAMTADRIGADGWDLRYFEPMDMSFAVPAGRMREEPASDMFLNYAHAASSLRYSLALGDLPEVAGIHGYALSSARAGSAPYALRREKLLITSADQPDGSILYARSDLRRNGWATLVLSAAARDRNLLGAVAGSIAKGRAGGFAMPPGGALATGITAMAAVMAEAGAADAPAGVDRMRRGMTAPLPAPRDAVPAEPPPASTAPVLRASGTAFIVSRQGHLLTNAHVVEGCETLGIDGQPIALLASDTNFDLALLKGLPPAGGKVAAFAARPAPLNADVTIAGYPLAGMLSGLNVTRGSVSSLKGLGGDATQMQISAPVQPGNSGGPAVDGAGRVIGVVVAKLDAKAIADRTGDIPQNVNFAVRGEMAKLFLFQNGVEPVLADDSAPRLDPVSLGRQLEELTRSVQCYGKPQ